MQRQSLVRACCQTQMKRKRAYWSMAVVMLLLLLAIITYKMARNTDDMTVGIDIDGYRHNDRADTVDHASDDGDVDEDSANDNWRMDRQQNRDVDVDFDGNANLLQKHDNDRGNADIDGLQSGHDGKTHQRGKSDDDDDGDDDEYDRERRGPAAKDEGNDRDAADRYELRGDGANDEKNRQSRGRDAEDDDDAAAGDRGPRDDGGKDEDANNMEQIKDADEVNGNVDKANEHEKEGGHAAEGVSGTLYDSCDAECQTFRSQLASWPLDKPKAFIYYLIHRRALRSLRKSIGALYQNFNRRFRYPIVVFVEPDLDNAAHRRRIADMAPVDVETASPRVYVQVVRFRIPEHVNASLVPPLAGFGSRKRTIGYRHMCRFHAAGVYDQPIVRSPGLEYGWRLDDDSLIRRPIGFDLFRVMREGGYQYGYRRINVGWSPVDYALWDAVDRYLNATPSLTPTFYRQWPKNAARFFNNFEVSYLGVWMSPQYRDYFDFVDRLGGIYYYKWGDAAIKTIAVTLFVPRDRTHRFRGIAYSHL